MIWPHSTRLSQLIAINLANYGTRAVRFQTKPTVSVPADWRKKNVRVHFFLHTILFSPAARSHAASRGEKASKLNYQHRGYLIPNSNAYATPPSVLRMQREMIREAAGHAHWARRIETHTQDFHGAYWSRNPPDGTQIVFCMYVLSMPRGEIE